MAGDEDDVATGFGDARCHRTDSDLSDQLHMDTRPRVRILEVVDELLDVFNGIDVVVWRRADQADTRRGMTSPRNPRVHLVTRQLAALARFGPLRHLYLQVVGIDQVLR